MTHEHAVQSLAAERYLLNEMSLEERDQFESHFFDCGACASDVRTGASLRAAVRRVTEEAGEHDLPPSGGTAVPGRRFRVGAMLPWALAASLGGVAIYQAAIVQPALREAADGQALGPVAVRAASRGEVTTIERRAFAHQVPLLVDVDASEGAPLTYAVRDANGQSILAGTTAAPAPGRPLLLLIPVARLAASGTYRITIDNAAAPSGRQEYPFQVVDR